jgi:hypothetical protein
MAYFSKENLEKWYDKVFYMPWFIQKTSNLYNIGEIY